MIRTDGTPTIAWAEPVPEPTKAERIESIAVSLAAIDTSESGWLGRYTELLAELQEVAA